VQQSAYIAAAAPAFLPPVGVPIGPMGAGRAALLAALDHLLSEPHLRSVLLSYETLTLEFGPREDQKPPQVVFIEIADRVEKVAVKRHLGHFEWCEQPDDGATVGKSPAQRWSHAIRVSGAHGVPGSGVAVEILQPNLSVGIAVGHAYGGGGAATDARRKHWRNGR